MNANNDTIQNQEVYEGVKEVLFLKGLTKCLEKI